MRRLTRWADRSLAVKTAVPLLLVTLAMTALSAWVLSVALTGLHDEDAESQAQRLAGVVNEALVLPLDAQRGHERLDATLGLLCRSTGRSALVAGPDGAVRFACRSDLVGTPLEDGLAKGQRIERGDSVYVRSVFPVEAGESCAGCHPAGPRGRVAVDVPITLSEAEVTEQRNLNVAVGAVLAAVLCLFTALVVVVYVSRPARTLRSAVERVRAGELSVRVPVRTVDELGQLSESVNAMARALLLAKEELERQHGRELAQAEKLAALGQLLSSVAHEIKNPLAGIIGALGVIVVEMPSDDQNLPIMKKILADMERLTRTAVNLLDFARPTPAQTVDVDLVELLERTVFFVERLALAQGIRIEKRYQRDLPQVPLDADLLRQILLNVVLNGIQAMPQGGTLELDVRRGEHGGVEVAVSDEGAGIDPEHLGRIFTPFFSTKPGGTGLGLYVARQMLATQHGAIRVESQPGRGSCFTLWLPTVVEWARREHVTS